MTDGGKHGNPKSGFPPFPPSLEIALRFPHSHRLDDPYNHRRDSKTESKNCYPCSRIILFPMFPGAPPFTRHFVIPPLSWRTPVTGQSRFLRVPFDILRLVE